MGVVWTLCGGEEGLVVSDGGCVDICVVVRRSLVVSDGGCVDIVWW